MLPQGETHLFKVRSADRQPFTALLRILGNWLVVGAVFFCLWRFPSPATWVSAFLIISIQQHALGLWLHEAIHWLLTSDKTLNDTLTRLLLSAPLYVPLEGYRRNHFTHHGQLGTPQDTKQVIFVSIQGKNALRFFLQNIFGLQLFSIAFRYITTRTSKTKSSSQEPWLLDLCLIAIVQLAFLGAISLFLPWTYYFWFWFLPWLTFSRFVAGLRSVAEHQPLQEKEVHPFTRTLKPTWLDRWVFCRAGFDYHWAHHRYPTIPWFRLHEIDHTEDMTANQSMGYFEVLRKHIFKP